MLIALLLDSCNSSFWPITENLLFDIGISCSKPSAISLESSDFNSSMISKIALSNALVSYIA